MQRKEMQRLYEIIHAGLEAGHRPEHPTDESEIDRWTLAGKSYLIAAREGRKTIVSLGKRRESPKDYLLFLSHPQRGQLADTHAEIYPNGVIEVFSSGLTATEISILLKEISGRLRRE